MIAAGTRSTFIVSIIIMNKVGCYVVEIGEIFGMSGVLHIIGLVGRMLGVGQSGVGG